MREATHVHVTVHSSDCDGQYTSEFVSRGTLWAIGLPNLPLGKGEFELKYNEADMYSLSFSAATEEGYIAHEYNECDDVYCDLNKPSSFRDHRAEEMGY